MPWRVFGFIGLLIVVTVFSALNLEHRADVSFGFHSFVAVPVFLTSLIAFTLGAVLAVLLTMPRRRTAPPAAPAAAAAPASDDAAVTPESLAEGDAQDPVEIPEEPPDRKPRQRRFGGRRHKEAQD